MNILSQAEIDSSYSLPANNITSFYIVGGLKGARADVKKAADEIIQRGRAAKMDEYFTKAYSEWYLNSCAYILNGIENGFPIRRDYAPFKWP